MLGSRGRSEWTSLLLKIKKLNLIKFYRFTENRPWVPFSKKTPKKKIILDQCLVSILLLCPMSEQVIYWYIVITGCISSIIINYFPH